MGYRLENSIELSIFFNQVEYPLDEMNILNMLHMQSSTMGKLPTCHFVVTDATGLIAKMKITDRTPIDIVINKNGVRRIYRFVLHNWRRDDGPLPMYHFDGYAAAPKYWSGTSNKSYRGTSSDVLSQIAAECGLGYVGAATNDLQYWLQRNMPYSTFAKYIAAHAYASDTAHLVLGVDLNGRMKFQDVRGIKPTAKVAYQSETQDAFVAQFFQPTTSSGVANAVNGYSDMRITQSVLTDSEIFDQMTFKPDSKKVLINPKVRAQVGQSNVTFGPLDFGNVHPNFEKAKYLSSRFNAVAALGAQFLFNSVTELDLLTRFTFSTSATSPGEYDGVYTVANRIIYVESSTYAEKIIAVKDGIQ